MLEPDASALVAATMGRGAWRVALADLPAECPLVGDTDSETGPPGDTMPLLDLPPPATTAPMTTSQPPDDPSTTSDTDGTSTGSSVGADGCGWTAPGRHGTPAWIALLALTALGARRARWLAEHGHDRAGRTKRSRTRS